MSVSGGLPAIWWARLTVSTMPRRLNSGIACNMALRGSSMRKDNRKFCASISVRNGERRLKLELSPASLHGGPEGFYRVRLARRWLDTEDGAPRFFDRDGIARLAAELALCLTFPAIPACLCGARTFFMKAPGRTRSRFWTTRAVGWSTCRWEESASSCRWKM